MVDNDIIDGFAAMKAFGAEKRRDNMRKSTALLLSRGVPIESRNNGVHLIVANAFDFWPSTGLWIDRRNRSRQGRGVFPLLREIQKQKGKP